MLEAKKNHTTNNGMTVSNIIYEEQGDKTWESKDGVKRKAILENVGPEYSQINYLAAVVAEIIKQDAILLDNPIIQDGMAKFAEIEAIRNS